LPPFLLLFFRDDDTVGVVFIRGSVIDEMDDERVGEGRGGTEEGGGRIEDFSPSL